MRASSNKILIIEDSSFYSAMLQKRISSVTEMESVPASTLAEAVGILDRDTAFFAAVADLFLPDAQNGEVVDLVLSHGIPLIILTSNIDENLRNNIISRKNVIDYILKHEAKGFDEITDLLSRLRRNRYIKILIVEDSATQRMKLKKILKTHNFEVVEAEHGVEALQRMEEHPDVRLVLTDYNMPKMNGYELVKELRRRYDRDQIAILGLSDMGNPILSAQFLKTGANDFVNKPFVVEELMARVTGCVEMLEMVRRLRDLAIKDPLTKLHNRRYFYEEAEKKLTESQKNGSSFAVGMIDIDHFKKINDTFGHDAGDKVLEILAEALHEDTRGADVVARLGGEEFCIATPNTDRKGAEILFEKIRKHVEALSLSYGEHDIRFTISIGVCACCGDSLESALKQSDEMLYAAKSRGRNRVVFDS